jgi:hypothetical protein
VPVEIGRCGSDGDAVPHSDDVAEQAPVAVHAVSHRLRQEAYSSAPREERLGPQRGRPPLTLTTEEHLGRVDLDEADALAVAKHNGVAVTYVVDSVDRRGSSG